MGKNASEGEAAQTRGPGQRAAVLGYGDEGRAHALPLRAAANVPSEQAEPATVAGFCPRPRRECRAVANCV